MRRLVHWLGAVVLVVATGSAAARAGSVQFALPIRALNGNQVEVQSWQSLKFARTVHQKYDFSCGSASLATLLTYVYKTPTTEMAVFKSMYDHGNKARIRRLGFSLLDMQNYLHRHGIASDGFKASLKKFAALRVPAIVLIDYHGYHHFVVVRGVRAGTVLISDPSLGLRTVPVSRFKKEWSGIFFVITSDVPEAQMAFNNPKLWQAVPQPPVGLAKFQLRDLAFPANGWQQNFTF